VAARWEPALIVLSGLPGTGKSLLAAGLSRQLGIPVLSVDPIESAMLRAGLAQSFETGLAAYLVVEAIADGALALGQSAIVDAVNCVDEAKAMWRALAERHGAPLRVIECHCSDEALHRQRLESRRRGLAPGFPEPTWDDVVRRRATYTVWTEPLLALDSVEPPEASLERALAWLRDGHGND
jgi:predicted kinase